MLTERIADGTTERLREQEENWKPGRCPVGPTYQRVIIQRALSLTCSRRCTDGLLMLGFSCCLRMLIRLIREP